MSRKIVAFVLNVLEWKKEKRMELAIQKYKIFCLKYVIKYLKNAHEGV